MLVFITSLIWTCISGLGLIVNGRVLHLANADYHWTQAQTYVDEQDLRDALAARRREQINFTCQLALFAAGFVRILFPIPELYETEEMRFRLITTTIAVVVVSILLVVKGLDNLRLRKVQKEEYRTGISRHVVMDILWARVPVLVITLEGGLIVKANQQSEELFGYEMAGELRGKLVDDLVPSTWREEYAKRRADYNSFPVQRHSPDRINFVKRDGTPFSVFILTIPALIDEQRCAIIVLADDT